VLLLLGFALGGCTSTELTIASQSVFQKCGRHLDSNGCEKVVWKTERELVNLFMSRFTEQEVVLGLPLRIQHHDDVRDGTDGKGPYVETAATLQGPKGETRATLRFARDHERWKLTAFRFEPLQR